MSDVRRFRVFGCGVCGSRQAKNGCSSRSSLKNQGEAGPLGRNGCPSEIVGWAGSAAQPSLGHSYADKKPTEAEHLSPHENRDRIHVIDEPHCRIGAEASVRMPLKSSRAGVSSR